MTVSTTVTGSSGHVTRAAGSPRRAAVELLADAHEVLERARTAPHVAARLSLAQVAAVRAAGAVLAVRARPALPGRGGPGGARRQRSAWELLPRLAPELGEWATHLATPVDLGRPGAGEVSPERAADDRVRDAERFLLAAERVVGRARSSSQPSSSQEG